MTHQTDKTVLPLVVIMVALCLSIIVTGCVAPPSPIPPGDQTPTAAPIIISPLPVPIPVGVLEIGGFADRDVSATLEIAAVSRVLDWQLEPVSWSNIQNQITETSYLEYALVLDDDKKWQLFYAEPPSGIVTSTVDAGPLTRIITPTHVQVHAVQQWQTNSVSSFTSGPIFEVASSGAISIPLGTRVEWKRGVELIGAATGLPAPVGEVREGETAFLLLSDGNSETPSYTLVVLAGVQAVGTVKELPPDQTNFGATCRKYCTSIGNRAWYCKLCNK